MIKRIFFYFGIGSCILFSGCNNEDLVSENAAGLTIVLTGDESLTTRSLPSELDKPIQESFTASVVSATDGQSFYNGLLKDFTKPLTLETGNYTVSATYGENPLIGWDTPYYIGRVETEVIKNKAQTVEVPCKVGNALAAFSITDSDKLSAFLSEYYIELAVSGTDDRAAEIEWRPTENRHPYFKAESKVNITLKGTRTDGSAYTLSIHTIESALPRTLYKYNLAVENTSGTGEGFSFKIDKSTETVTLSETIPENWLPAPKIVSDAFDANNVLTYTETSSPSVEITYSTTRSAEEAVLTLHIEDPNLSSVTGEYNLSALTDEQKAKLATADIKLYDLDNGAGKKIDLSDLTASLVTGVGGSEVLNHIGLKVKANGRETERNYTIKTVKPEFALSVYPGNIWTKEFTVSPLSKEDVTAGNVEKISSDLAYQYSADGNTWNTLPGDYRLAELNPGDTYYVRGIYRGDIYSNVKEVTTYRQIALENGGLEGGSVSIGADKNGSKYGAVYTWAGWSTLNELTCDDTNAFIWGNTAFNSRSGTRPSSEIRPGSSGTSSIRIMTMGYGYGNWSGPDLYTPSELFLGSLTDVDHKKDTATKNYGISYASHPTGVRFYYKYAPYDNDKSDIFVKVMHDDTVLGEGQLQETNSIPSFTEYTMNITYDEQYKGLEVNKLILVFKSGFNTSVKDYGTSSKMGSNSAEPSHRGSELYIDDIELTYDK
ncbi:DUF4493 domain-containing protein [Phocaeicola sp.]